MEKISLNEEVVAKDVNRTIVAPRPLITFSSKEIEEGFEAFVQRDKRCYVKTIRKIGLAE